MPKLRESQQGVLDYGAMWDDGEMHHRKRKNHRHTLKKIDPDENTRHHIGQVKEHNRGPYRRQEI